MVQTEWDGSTNKFILVLTLSRPAVVHFHLKLSWILQFVYFPRFFSQVINEYNQ